MKAKRGAKSPRSMKRPIKGNASLNLPSSKRRPAQWDISKVEVVPRDRKVSPPPQTEAAESKNDFAYLINSLKSSSRQWLEIRDQSAKEKIITYHINKFRESGIVIKKDPRMYAAMIDNMFANNSKIAANPINRVLQIVAIIEYDFDNGRDKDMMARKVMGEKAYLDNKRRLGL